MKPKKHADPIATRIRWGIELETRIPATAATLGGNRRDKTRVCSKTRMRRGASRFPVAQGATNERGCPRE